MVAMPIVLANLVAFLASGFWGWVADIFGRRWAMIIPAVIGVCVTPLYLFTTIYPMVVGASSCRARSAARSTARIRRYLSERFPTEVRATATGFCYHQGAIWAGFTAPVLTYFAVSQPARLRHPDAGRHDRRRDQVRHRAAAQPGDQGQGAGSAAHLAASCRVTATARPSFGRPRGSCRKVRTPGITVPLTLQASADEVIVELSSPAGNRKWSKQLWATQGSFAEAGHILLRLLRARHAGLPMNSICSSKVWPPCKRLARMR